MNCCHRCRYSDGDSYPTALNLVSKRNFLGSFSINLCDACLNEVACKLESSEEFAKFIKFGETAVYLKGITAWDPTVETRLKQTVELGIEAKKVLLRKLKRLVQPNAKLISKNQETYTMGRRALGYSDLQPARVGPSDQE